MWWVLAHFYSADFVTERLNSSIPRGFSTFSSSPSSSRFFPIQSSHEKCTYPRTLRVLFNPLFLPSRFLLLLCFFLLQIDWMAPVCIYTFPCFFSYFLLLPLPPCLRLFFLKFSRRECIRFFHHFCVWLIPKSKSIPGNNGIRRLNCFLPLSCGNKTPDV